ncbi:MAG TPA: efflux RND transporter periplasmic adaptor subunit [Gemmatimonadaceae bacterium]|nr:efflux RND transporter periplasmic adaptor subunit [Gemmatimonadaceae bacterium]
MSTRYQRASMAAIALVVVAACSKKDPPRQPTVPVSVTTVTRSIVPYIVTANGVAEPMQTVAVEAQVNGILQRVAFAEGQEVQAGQVLFQIDPRPYQAVLNQARAQLTRDEAIAANARRDATRYAALVKEGYVTSSQADQADANAVSAAANVEGDRANVQKAALDLANTTIRAPISGKTGSLLVRQGNLVKANSEPPLVIINQIRPILVRFSVPQSQFTEIQRYYRSGNALLVRSRPSEGTSIPVDGTLAFVDNNVDTTTGTVMLKARFTNPEGTIWPGQYMNIALQLYVDANALTLPAPAVLTGQQGTYVYTVDTANTAKQTPVQVARTLDSVAVIASGLREGERVVVDGQSRLLPGAKVAIRGAPRTTGAAGAPAAPGAPR